MAAYIIRVVSGGSSGASMPFSSGTAIIGRDPSSDLVIDDPQVSRFHARLTESDGYVVLHDLQSSNGTMVNGARVTRTVLIHGDTIAIGDTEISFTQEEDASQEVRPAEDVSPPKSVDETPPAPPAQTPPASASPRTPERPSGSPAPQSRPAAQTPRAPVESPPPRIPAETTRPLVETRLAPVKASRSDATRVCLVTSS